jgi:hypothetical protein
MKDLERCDRVAANVERGMAPRDLLLHAGEGTTFATEPCEGIGLSGRFHYDWLPRQSEVASGRMVPRAA